MTWSGLIAPSDLGILLLKSANLEIEKKAEPSAPPFVDIEPSQ